MGVRKVGIAGVLEYHDTEGVKEGVLMEVILLEALALLS